MWAPFFCCDQFERHQILLHRSTNHSDSNTLDGFKVPFVRMFNSYIPGSQYEHSFQFMPFDLQASTPTSNDERPTPSLPIRHISVPEIGQDSSWKWSHDTQRIIPEIHNPTKPTFQCTFCHVKLSERPGGDMKNLNMYLRDSGFACPQETRSVSHRHQQM